MNPKATKLVLGAYFFLLSVSLRAQSLAPRCLAHHDPQGNRSHRQDLY